VAVITIGKTCDTLGLSNNPQYVVRHIYTGKQNNEESSDIQ
jgi:hypothetical protein